MSGPQIVWHSAGASFSRDDYLPPRDPDLLERQVVGCKIYLSIQGQLHRQLNQLGGRRHPRAGLTAYSTARGAWQCNRCSQRCRRPGNWPQPPDRAWPDWWGRRARRADAHVAWRARHCAVHARRREPARPDTGCRPDRLDDLGDGRRREREHRAARSRRSARFAAKAFSRRSSPSVVEAFRWPAACSAAEGWRRPGPCPRRRKPHPNLRACLRTSCGLQQGSRWRGLGQCWRWDRGRRCRGPAAGHTRGHDVDH